MNRVIWLIAIKVIALFAVVGLVVFLMLPAKAAELKPYEGGTPSLVLSSFEGKSVTLAQFKGKLTLVQFWATYCTPCRVEMPSMNRLQAKMGDDLKILAVNMGESKEEVRQFIEEVKPEFTILMDEAGGTLAEWKVFAAPATFVIDPAGRIRYTLFGATEWDSNEMVEKLKSLI